MSEYETVIEKYFDSQSKMATINGLMMAQVACQRRFLDASNSEASAQQVLSLVMKDIAEIMGELVKDNG